MKRLNPKYQLDKGGKRKKIRKTNSNATAIKYVLYLSPVKTKNILSNS